MDPEFAAVCAVLGCPAIPIFDASDGTSHFLVLLEESMRVPAFLQSVTYTSLGLGLAAHLCVSKSGASLQMDDVQEGIETMKYRVRVWPLLDASLASFFARKRLLAPTDGIERDGNTQKKLRVPALGMATHIRIPGKTLCFNFTSAQNLLNRLTLPSGTRCPELKLETSHRLLVVVHDTPMWAPAVQCESIHELHGYQADGRAFVMQALHVTNVSHELLGLPPRSNHVYLSPDAWPQLERLCHEEDMAWHLREVGHENVGPICFSSEKVMLRALRFPNSLINAFLGRGKLIVEAVKNDPGARRVAVCTTAALAMLPDCLFVSTVNSTDPKLTWHFALLPDIGPVGRINYAHSEMGIFHLPANVLLPEMKHHNRPRSASHVISADSGDEDLLLMLDECVLLPTRYCATSFFVLFPLRSVDEYSILMAPPLASAYIVILGKDLNVAYADVQLCCALVRCKVPTTTSAILRHVIFRGGKEGLRKNPGAIRVIACSLRDEFPSSEVIVHKHVLGQFSPPESDFFVVESEEYAYAVDAVNMRVNYVLDEKLRELPAPWVRRPKNGENYIRLICGSIYDSGVRQFVGRRFIVLWTSGDTRSTHNDTPSTWTEVACGLLMHKDGNVMTRISLIEESQSVPIELLAVDMLMGAEIAVITYEQFKAALQFCNDPREASKYQLQSSVATTNTLPSPIEILRQLVRSAYMKAFNSINVSTISPDIPFYDDMTGFPTTYFLVRARSVPFLDQTNVDFVVSMLARVSIHLDNDKHITLTLVETKVGMYADYFEDALRVSNSAIRVYPVGFRTVAQLRRLEFALCAPGKLRSCKCAQNPNTTIFRRLLPQWHRLLVPDTGGLVNAQVFMDLITGPGNAAAWSAHLAGSRMSAEAAKSVPKLLDTVIISLSQGREVVASACRHSGLGLANVIDWLELLGHSQHALSLKRIMCTPIEVPHSKCVPLVSLISNDPLIITMDEYFFNRFKEPQAAIVDPILAELILASYRTMKGRYPLSSVSLFIAASVDNVYCALGMQRDWEDTFFSREDAYRVRWAYAWINNAISETRRIVTDPQQAVIYAPAVYALAKSGCGRSANQQLTAGVIDSSYLAVLNPPATRCGMTIIAALVADDVEYQRVVNMSIDDSHAHNLVMPNVDGTGIPVTAVREDAAAVFVHAHLAYVGMMVYHGRMHFAQFFAMYRFYPQLLSVFVEAIAYNVQTIVISKHQMPVAGAETVMVLVSFASELPFAVWDMFAVFCGAHRRLDMRSGYFPTWAVCVVQYYVAEREQTLEWLSILPEILGLRVDVQMIFEALLISPRAEVWFCLVEKTGNTLGKRSPLENELRKRVGEMCRWQVSSTISGNVNALSKICEVRNLRCATILEAYFFSLGLGELYALGLIEEDEFWSLLVQNQTWKNGLEAFSSGPNVVASCPGCSLLDIQIEETIEYKTTERFLLKMSIVSLLTDRPTHVDLGVLWQLGRLRSRMLRPAANGESFSFPPRTEPMLLTA
jgi:hypothetical protein